MSHELRAPLKAIIGFAELMLTHDVEQMAADQRRGDITDILDCSKREADHLPLGAAVFDLRQFLHDGWRLVRAQAEAGGVALHLPTAPAVAVEGDERRLCQCVVNPLANAIKFAPHRHRSE